MLNCKTATCNKPLDANKAGDFLQEGDIPRLSGGSRNMSAATCAARQMLVSLFPEASLKAIVSLQASARTSVCALGFGVQTTRRG